MTKAKTMERPAAAGTPKSNSPTTDPRTQAIPEIVVSNPVRPAGICSTCRHQSRCMFCKAARQGIHHCEEFDDRSQAGDGPNVAARTISRAGDINLGQGQATGLCVNCDTRLTCIHRTPGESVLECEDYT